VISARAVHTATNAGHDQPPGRILPACTPWRTTGSGLMLDRVVGTRPMDTLSGKLVATHARIPSSGGATLITP
jgi:hypothetical protein